MANNKQQVAYLKCTYYDHFHNLRQETTIYKKMFNSNRENMQLAIKNMAFKSGMTKVETITPEEYQEATSESDTQIQS